MQAREWLEGLMTSDADPQVKRAVIELLPVLEGEDDVYVGPLARAREQFGEDDLVIVVRVAEPQ